MSHAWAAVVPIWTSVSTWSILAYPFPPDFSPLQGIPYPSLPGCTKILPLPPSAAVFDLAILVCYSLCQLAQIGID